MAKILNWEEPFEYIRTFKGRNYVKGDYNVSTKLYPIVTDNGTYNLYRSEVLALLASLGFSTIKYVTAAALQKLVGSHIDVTKIQDK